MHRPRAAEPDRLVEQTLPVDGHAVQDQENVDDVDRRDLIFVAVVEIAEVAVQVDAQVDQEQLGGEDPDRGAVEARFLRGSVSGRIRQAVLAGGPADLPVRLDRQRLPRRGIIEVVVAVGFDEAGRRVAGRVQAVAQTLEELLDRRQVSSGAIMKSMSPIDRRAGSP